MKQVAGGLTGMGSLLASIPGQMKSINDAGGSMSDKLMAGATSIGAAIMMGVQLFDSWVQGQDAIVRAAGEAGEEVLNLADAYEASGKSLEDNVALVNGLGDANANLKSSLLAVVTDQEAFNAQLAVAKEEARQAKIAAQELNEGGLNPMLRFLTDLDPAMKAHRMRLAEQTIATEEAVEAQVAMAQALNNVQNQLQATLTEGSQKLKEINQSLIETFGTEAEQDKAKIQAILDDAKAKMEELAPLQLAESWDNVGLLVGDPAQPVSTILVGLDASSLVLDQAAEQHAELLVVHHPLLFSGIKRLVEDRGTTTLLRRLICEGCSLVAMHTNLDSAPDGLNTFVASRLGLGNLHPLVPMEARPFLKLVVYVPESHAFFMKAF